ncbi:MAG TPA: glycosyltransferase [Aliiroseovarius sp.]|nr:glycosyltransferase [Aliiroseovarius sp.]
MTAPPVSVIVVSRGRPEMLRRCLTGIGQLFYPCYEVVVVADPSGAQAVRDMGLTARIKLVEYDEPNISHARNLGIAAAAGRIVAFVDDDAVPEPTWLDHLIEAFDDPAIVAAGGFVRGRNGISYQFRAAFVSPTGRDVAIDTDGMTAFVPDPPAGHAVKTTGTNCAFRRKNVALMGGFDPVFSFFHDETDLNMRLMRAGGKTAVVPLAQVHHGFAASERRHGNRAPVSLEDVGASTVLFLRKHAPETALEPACDALTCEQHARLARYVADGRLDRSRVEPLMQGLRQGMARGRTTDIRPLAPLGAPAQPFRPYADAGGPRRSVVIAARPWSGAQAERGARAQVAAGNVVTLIRLSPTALFHRVRFLPDGYWLQTGGVFGRAVRDEPIFRPTTFRRRVEKEWQRVARLRQSPENMTETGDANKNFP